jgi:hypothetical protein
VSDSESKVREFKRLGWVGLAIVVSVCSVNLVYFGDFYSVQDCLALKTLSGIGISNSVADRPSTDVRIDKIVVRNLTFRSVRILGVHNSCGPVLGNDVWHIAPLSSVELFAWENASVRFPVYKVYNSFGSDPLKVRLGD